MRVLVTDANGNHALAVIRSLGKRGIHVTAADSVRFAKSFFSRCCAERALYPSPTLGIRKFQKGLYRILDEHRPDMLMPMTERTISALTVDREQIESRGIILILPSQDAIRVAFNKDQTIRLAKSLGVPVPRTFSLCHLRDLEEVRPEVSYPAVIKPRASEIRTVGDRIVPSGPVEYCFRPEDLEVRYLAVHRRAPLPLIQEFIPGEGYGISVLCNRGQVRALFAHRRLRMIRPTGSGSSLRESVAPPPAMAEAACRLLEALEWHGGTMVEFKLDRRDGTPKLMEINGRFWNSLPLAVAAGIDFPFLLYKLGTEGGVPECREYRMGVRCRWLVGDARHLVEVLRGRPAGWIDDFPSRWKTVLDFLKFFGRDLFYDDLWLSDPAPFVAEIGDFLLRKFPAFIFKRPSAAVEEMPGSTVF